MPVILLSPPGAVVSPWCPGAAPLQPGPVPLQPAGRGWAGTGPTRPPRLRPAHYGPAGQAHCQEGGRARAGGGTG